MESAEARLFWLDFYNKRLLGEEPTPKVVEVKKVSLHKTVDEQVNTIQTFGFGLDNYFFSQGVAFRR